MVLALPLGRYVGLLGYSKVCTLAYFSIVCFISQNNTQTLHTGSGKVAQIKAEHM